MKTDYDMNNKPLVKATSVAPFGKNAYRQGDSNKGPVVKVPASKAAFGQNVMPSNKVTDGSSASLQKASKLSGRASMSGAPVDLG